MQSATRAILRNRPLVTLACGHFTVDLYVGLLPVLYPLLLGRFHLDLKSVGFVALAYTGMASLSQPFFGWLADKYGTRLIGLSLIWSALTFSFAGLAPTFPILLLLTGAAGLGSGFYHPFGAVSVKSLIPDGQRNNAMSFYVTGGTLGVAVGPVLGALIFKAFGLHGTLVMLLPGLLASFWLWSSLHGITPPDAKDRASQPARIQRANIVPLLVVIGVMMSRTCTLSSLQAFIPTWYKLLGYGPAFYGLLATTLLLASAVGTVGAGSLANRFGRRAVIVGTLALTIPALWLFVQFPGPGAFITAFTVGLLAASTAPLLLIMAQQLMTGRAGVASGLILGIGFVTGAIGVPITGALADRFGIQHALMFQILLVTGTIPLACLLPNEDRLTAVAHPIAAGALAEAEGRG